MKTLDTILNDMEKRVEENIPISPAQWLDGALKVNALRGDLDNAIAETEAQLVNEEVKLLENPDISSAKAKTIAKTKIDYAGLLKGKAKSKRIEEFLRLSKKYSQINEYNI